MNQTDSDQDKPAIVIPTSGQSNVVASLIQRGLLPAGATVIPIEEGVVSRRDVEAGLARYYHQTRRISPDTLKMIRRKVRQIVRTGTGHEWPGVMMAHLAGTTTWTPTPKSFGVRRTVRIG